MEEQKSEDKKVESAERKGFPFKAQITGPTQTSFEIGGLNAPAYDLTEGHITGTIRMKDGFPIENVQVHKSVTIDAAHLERLLLILRHHAYEAYEKIRISAEEATSALGLAVRAIQSGNIQFVESNREQAMNQLLPLKGPPPLDK